MQLAEDHNAAPDAPRVSSGVLDLTPVTSGVLEEDAKVESGEEAKAITSAAAGAADVAVTGLRQRRQQVPSTGLAASSGMVTEDKEVVHERGTDSALLKVCANTCNAQLRGTLDDI